jgi:hypothetical protein
LNNPLRFRDPSGEVLEAAGTDEERQASLDQIRDGLPEADREHVRIVPGDGENGTEEGKYYVQADNDHKSDDANYNDLRRIVNSPGQVKLSQTTEGATFEALNTTSGSVETFTVSEGLLGIVLPTLASIPTWDARLGLFSTIPGVTQALINPGDNPIENAVTMGHELYGHALPALLGTSGADHTTSAGNKFSREIDDRTRANAQ